MSWHRVNHFSKLHFNNLISDWNIFGINLHCIVDGSIGIHPIYVLLITLGKETLFLTHVNIYINKTMDWTVRTIPISKRYLRLLKNGFSSRQKDYFWTGIAVATFPASASSDLQRDVTVFVSVKKLIPCEKRFILL